MAAPQDIALLGSGIFAREAHLPAIQASPHLTLKAVYSRKLASIAALCEGLAQKVDWYADETAADARGLPELLAQPNIKGVVVALPIAAQPAVIRAALKAGKHVLSEKPIAKDVATARDLLRWYHESGEVDPARTRWCVAENWRWVGEYEAAAAALQSLGRPLGFRLKIDNLIHQEHKYFGTAWRATPAYQGGFVLDVGVHYAAGLRLILGGEKLARVAAFSGQMQAHLAPVDTLHGILKTTGGASGSFGVEMGTTNEPGPGLVVAAEKGSITVGKGTLSVRLADGSITNKSFDFQGEASGVHKEVKAWAAGLAGEPFSPLLAPEQALADLEVVEAMLRSGENDGAPVNLLLQ